MTKNYISTAVAYPVSQVSYRWHNPTMAVGYEGELQLSQFDIINTKYRQVSSCHLSVSCQPALVISPDDEYFTGDTRGLVLKISPSP